MKIWRGLIRLALAVGTVATLAACGGSSHGSFGSTPATTSDAQEQGQQGWLGSDATSVAFLQWVENPDHTLTGQVNQFSTVPGDTFTAAITGVHRGSSVSITMSAAGASYTANGTLEGRTLTLNFAQPDGTIETETFSPASVTQYNSEVRNRQGQLTAVAAKAAATQESATAQARAAEAEAVAGATATAQASAAAIGANEQRTCAAVNGHLVPGDFFGRPYKRCAANLPTPGCEVVDFNPDGTISRENLMINNDFYPGCFPQAKDVSYDIAPCVRSNLSSDCR